MKTKHIATENPLVRCRMACIFSTLADIRGTGLTVANIADESADTDGQVRYALDCMLREGLVVRAKQECRSRCGTRRAWVYFVASATRGPARTAGPEPKDRLPTMDEVTAMRAEGRPWWPYNHHIKVSGGSRARMAHAAQLAGVRGDIEAKRRADRTLMVLEHRNGDWV